MMTNPPSPKNSSAPPPLLTVWQWNCRSFRKKQPSLTLLALQHSPDLTAFQETNTDYVSVRGYTTYATDPTSRTAVLVQATQTAQTHTLPTPIDYTFVELLPRKKTEASLYFLNTYSPPTQPLPAIDRLLRMVRQRSRGHRLVVLGNFNAQHTAWDNAAIDAHLLHLYTPATGYLDELRTCRLGYTPPAECEQKKGIPLAIRHSIKARREARIRALKVQYEHYPDSSFTRYTDTSPYPQQPAHAVSVTDAHCKELTAATILTTSIETSEELAIAFRGNEAEHAAARVHTHRAVPQEGNVTQTLCTFKPTPLQKYPDILAHYRHERRQFPPPHSPPPLSRPEATAFRRLQTNSYSHGTLLHAMYPTLYPATCNVCSQPGTLYLMVWELGQLISSDLSSQRSLVERARATSVDQGFPD
ncbi:hypothetical protein HPB47_027542 [Ixodes persulcatus]|uniref:Uncharacterized protein n=1 Tax=Ixodes persulcatus TaxID=34615 RepID=A0AC60PW84_IXOPE|nr:hypothetical protein HPB47_027542 [Ixodes persulcatus]